MYNKIQKIPFVRQFADGSTKLEKSFVRSFRVSSKFEAALNKDISAFTQQELTDMLDKVKQNGTGGTQGFYTFVENLRLYGSWCLREKLPGAAVPITKCNLYIGAPEETQFVRNAYELERYLSVVFPSGQGCSNSQCDYNSVTCAYFWLAFIGVPQDQLADIKTSDVDFETWYVHAGDMYYPFGHAAHEIFLRLVRSDTLVISRKDGKSISAPREHSDQLLRTTTPYQRGTIGPNTSRKMRAAVQDGIVNKTISYKSVYKSGLCARIYERESVDGGDVVLDYVKTFIYNNADGTASMAISRAAYLHETYGAWKLAFHI